MKTVPEIPVQAATIPVGNPMVRPHTRGFTLIEILAVLIIIGVVTAVSVISVRSLGGSNDPEGQSALRLAGLIELASQNARLENIQYGLIIKPQAYEFVKYMDHSWMPIIRDPVFGKHTLPSGITLSASVQNPVRMPTPVTAAGAATAQAPASANKATGRDSNPMQPQIAILSTGEMTPFTLRLTGSNHSVYILRGDANGQVHIEPPNAASSAAPNP